MSSNLVAARLSAHLLRTPAPTIADAARHMAATQAQELWGGRFALSVRTAGAPTAHEVDAAFDRGEIVRTWPMRGTLHIVAADDLSWVLTVATDRVFRSAAARHRSLGLDADDFLRAERIVRATLAAGGLRRAEVFDAFRAGGLDPAGQRGTHLLIVLAMRSVAHWGAVVDRGEQPATEQLFTLNDHLGQQRPAPDDATAELFRRYLVGHGPATADDFAWWSGLTLTEARRAADVVVSAGSAQRVDDLRLDVLRDDAARGAQSTGVLLLPSFDEYYLSYRDRTVACAAQWLDAVGPGANGMVRPILLRDGRVVATWTRAGDITQIDPTESFPHEALATYREHIT